MKKQLKTMYNYRSLMGLLVLSFLSSCSLFRPLPANKVQRSQSPFFDQISITLDGKKNVVQQKEDSEVSPDITVSAPDYLSAMPGIEYIPPVVFRYAVLLDIEVEKISNRKLIEYVHQWWGVPYRIGGNSPEGIDCSAFVKGLASDAFGFTLPRTSREQADFCRSINRDELKEGDLVFFSQGRMISHVGMYISNNKFVHASTSMGVVISDLDEPYWKKRFVKAGRMGS